MRRSIHQVFTEYRAPGAYKLPAPHKAALRQEMQALVLERLPLDVEVQVDTPDNALHHRGQEYHAMVVGHTNNPDMIWVEPTSDPDDTEWRLICIGWIRHLDEI